MWIRIHEAVLKDDNECYFEVYNMWILPIEELRQNTKDFAVFVREGYISICWIRK